VRKKGRRGPAAASTGRGAGVCKCGHSEQSAVAEHSMNHEHHILFQDTRILSTKSSYVDRPVREVIELELQPKNMNREDGLILSGSRKPLFSLLTGSKWPPQQW
jgi:hypothetical protein